MHDKILKLATYYQQNCRGTVLAFVEDEESLPCQKIHKMNNMQWQFRLEELNENIINFKLAEYLAKKTLIKHSAYLNPFNTPTNTITEYLRVKLQATHFLSETDLNMKFLKDRLLYGDAISLIADKKIKSLLADYDWTTSQHLINNFGAQNCGQYNADQRNILCQATLIEQDQVLGNSTINQDTNTHQIV